MALQIFNERPTIQASNDLNPALTKTLTSSRQNVPVISPVRVPMNVPTPTLVSAETAQQIPMRRIQVPVQSVPVISTVRVPVGHQLPMAPVPMPAPTSLVAVKQPQVIPNLDRFVRPTLAKRLPAPVGIPTKAAEDEAMPGAGMKRVVGADVAPLRAIKPLPLLQKKEIQHFTPSAPITSNLASKVAQNSSDSALVAGGPVPSPPWYVDNYMHEWDALSSDITILPVGRDRWQEVAARSRSGMGAVDSSTQNWGWFLAAGLAVSAAWFWQKSR